MKWHVFPEGRLCSLRGALMLWLLPVFVLVGVASAAVSYWTYSRMVSSFMDEQMQQLGHSVAANETNLALPQLTEGRVDEWGAYVTQVFDASGQPRASTWPPAAVPVQAGEGFHDVQHDGRRWRAFVVASQPGGARVQILQSESFRSHLAAERAGAAIAPVLLLLPLSMLVLWCVARAMSRALQQIGREAAGQDEHSIAELHLEHVPQEITPLVTSFNSLLRRLRDAFATQRHFVQDAAHELRTPITAIGLQLENLRGDLAPGAAAAERFTQLEAGVRRAQRLVDQLLRLSRQEAAGADGPGLVDLQSQLRESICAMIALADQRRIDLGLVAPEQPVQPTALRCASGDLRSLLDNLIENALRYTPEGGVVDVRLLEENGKVAVEVVDTGPGIPQDMLPRVFDRFFRVPGHGVDGSGLGLAIARGAAQRCGLSITLRNRQDRSGLVARIERAA